MLEKRVRKLVSVDAMPVGFMSGRGTTDTLFVAKRIKESTKRKCYRMSLYIEKGFDNVPRIKLF